MKLAKIHDIKPMGETKLTVVMIHGIASDAHTYDHALKYLGERPKMNGVRFMTFDLLGAGKSYAGDELNYDYKDQLAALDESIAGIEGPLVLVGHSLGTFITTRYVYKNPEKVSGLILVSPPIYTPEDFENPAFMVAVKAFEKVIGAKNPEILETKAFQNSMKNIVLDRKNYAVLAGIKIPTILIYGNEDQIIASHNIPRALKENSNISAIKTHGRHGVTHDKYVEIEKALEKFLHA